jgi:hypothetical protein
MLSLFDRRADRNCQGYCRREFLKVGSLGLLGLNLPDVLATRASAAGGYGSGRPITGKSVVLLFLQGGPSHIETFDPKMAADERVRSITGAVKTALPGVAFGGTFPKLARLANQFTVVRNYGSKNGDHNYLPVTGGNNALKATMSAMYTRVAGPINPRTGVPTNVVLMPEAVQPGLKLSSQPMDDLARPTLTTAGDLGSTYAAVDPSANGEFRRLMQLQLDPARFNDRRQLLGKLDSLRRNLDASGQMENLGRQQQQAFDLVMRGVIQAFDLTKEDPKTVDRYDTSKFLRMEEAHRWHDMKRSTNLLGRQLLLSRRLCEAGVGFVTVSDCGWDMHSNGNSPNNMGSLNMLGPQVDHAVAAFLEDVRQRGLSEQILLMVTGEMGRYPVRNRDGGREHWGELTPLLLAGGGLKMGQVIGESDKHAMHPAADPQTPANLLATVMRTLLDVNEIRTMTNLGKTADIVTGGTPIPGLLPE